METRKVPYQRTIVVCGNVREDGSAACANPSRGEDRGDAILEALKAEAKRLGLKGKIRVARSGCLDLCAKGPNLFIFPDGVWLSGVTLADVPRLVETYLTPPVSAS